MADMHDQTSVEKTPDPIATAAQSPAAPVAAPPAELRFDASTTTSASLELNAVPCVYAVEVHTRERLAGTLLRVTIDGEIDGQPAGTATIFSRGLETIDAGVSLAVDTAGLELPVELLRRSTEREQVDLVATLGDANGRTLASTRHRLTIVPASHWCGTQITCESLAAFVTSNTPAIAEILRDVSARMQKSTGSGALDGYLSGSPARVQHLAEACYEALSARDITYITAQPSFETAGQKVRTAGEVLADGLGNCLDLAVTLAALFEACGLWPMIALGDGHAVVAFATIDSHFPDAVHLGPSRLENRVALGEARVIEATSVCGATSGFGAALATGERWLTDASDSILVVDIRAARAAGFHPVPERLERRAIRRFDGKPAPDDQWTVVQPAGLPPLPKPKLTPRERRLESWRKKLLDLTLRNKLLNDRDKAGVPLFAEGDEAIALLEDTLWNETPLVLKARGAMRDMSPAHVADEIGRRILRSTLDDDELFKRATKAHRDARSSLEETGARALFVAVGFLEYSVEQRKEPLRAPLVLVPVELERISRSEGFRVRPVADDTVPNAALVESLRAAHGLDIGLGTGLGSALVEDEHGLDIGAILTRVRQAVKDVPGARILPIAKLGIYSFKKLPLVEEMRARGAALGSHGIVSTLLDRAIAPELRNARLVSPAAVDDEAPFGAMRLPLPADSSQIAAIVSATKGSTFVLQGPPGTGKSQTITNLLSECLARGKRVLFIAEKSAALGVVSERLRKAGLGAFALDLHAEHATKTSFVSQVKAALDEIDARAAPNARQFATVATGVDKPRVRLRASCDALHATAAGGLSAFDAINRSFDARAKSAGSALPAGALDAAVRPDLDASDIAARLDAVATLADAARDLPPDATAAHAGLSPTAVISPEGALEAAKRARAASTAVERVSDAGRELCALLGISQRTTLGELARAAAFAASLDSGSRAAPALAAAAFAADHATRLDALARAVDLGERAAKASADLDARYDRAVLALPLAALAGDLRAARERFILFRWLAARKARAALARVSRNAPPSGVDELLAEFERLVAADAAIKAGDSVATELRTFADAGAAIDFAAARAAIERTRAAARTAREHFARELASLAAHVPEHAGAGAILPRAEAARHAIAALDAALAAVDEAVAATGAFRSNERTPADLAERLARLESGAASLPAWSAFTTARAQATSLGLEPVAHALATGALDPVYAEDAVEAELLAAWVRLRLRSESALADCASDRAELLRRNFLDAMTAYRKGAADAVAVVVRDRAKAALESADSDPAMRNAVRIVNELRALTTIRRPIRRVMGEAAPALAAIKPLVLASPLSAATMLPPDFPPFDLVVFDEASQVPVWDAACAISRGSAAVIVGDSKQLPPTNFFDRKDAGESTDAEAELADALEPLESVLEEAIASGIPQQSLLWHYRSRDERLIEFSNRKSYGGRLQTFPAAHRAHPNLGVEFRFVGGVYDRAGTATNRIEAEAVVAEIVRRLTDADACSANRSIGVVTFSVAQQTLVQDLFDEALDRDARVREGLAESVKLGDPVFIKNLENVQGDERATMLFSICYGRDGAGAMHHNFGPLNLSGGERRLNVAVTRAREKIVIFSSIRASDLDPKKCLSKGAQDLRDYLAFAELGTVPTARDEAGPQRALDIDAVETALARELESRGWKVDLHVGRSRDFRISLALADRATPERWRLGVELDGVFHRAAPTVIDRESVREGVLGGLGWRTMRVSAIDALRDLAGTVARIDAAARAAD
jgi:very-short-patch-repair endonuclease